MRSELFCFILWIKVNKYDFSPFKKMRVVNINGGVFSFLVICSNDACIIYVIILL